MTPMSLIGISAMTAATRSLMSSCSSRVLRIIRWVRVSYGASMVSRSLCADDAGLVLAQVQLDVVGEPRVGEVRGARQDPVVVRLDDERLAVQESSSE